MGCWWILLLLLFDDNGCGCNNRFDDNNCCCNTFIITHHKKKNYVATIIRLKITIVTPIIVNEIYVLIAKKSRQTEGMTILKSKNGGKGIKK
jgi:hypothetical protein